MTRILIVDDDPMARKTLTDIIKVKGYEPVAAKSGSEGIEEAGRGFINLALIDLKLPDMSGIEVVSRIKSISPSTEAIIVTGHATMESAIEAVNKGAFSYLVKPYDMHQLLLQIHHGIEKQRAEMELKQRLDDLERLNRLMVGRELRMEEMRRENEMLKRRVEELERR